MILRSVLLLLALLSSIRPISAEVAYGFTNFPYDLTINAVGQVNDLTLPQSTLYAQHMDQCLPWHEVISGSEFPGWLRSDLDEIRALRSPSQVMYVAVTPTQNDRRSLAEACGSTDDSVRKLPRSLRGKGLDSPEVKAAYVSYVRRIIDELHPEYMNIGIEMSELALRWPDEWAAFDSLFRYTVDEVRKSHPEVKLGLEVVIQSIMKKSVGDQVRPTAEYGDYVGLSFYPYGSEYGELFGAPKLPAPPEQWLQPLNFARQWTGKPLAMAETGYLTENIRLDIAGGLDFNGSDALQSAYLQDAIRIAIRDNYLFFVWFVPVDYTKLLRKMGGRAAEWMRIWVDAGLYDADLQPKPAMNVWQNWRRQGALAAEQPAKIRQAPKPRPVISAPEPKSGVSFQPEPDLTCSSSASVVRATPNGPDSRIGAVEWILTYANDWELCSVKIRMPATSKGMEFYVQSTPQDQLLVQVEENDGDIFYTLIDVTPKWRAMKLRFSRFVSSPNGNGNNMLEPSKIERVTFADGGGADGKKGRRIIGLTAPIPLQ